MANVLILPSLNEGLTLTAYEAVSRGVLVISSDVGAQHELLPAECLVNIWCNNPTEQFVTTISYFIDNPDQARNAILASQRNLKRLQQETLTDNIIQEFYGVIQ